MFDNLMSFAVPLFAPHRALLRDTQLRFLLKSMAGVALMAVGIWVVVDPYKMYPVCTASGKTDIFAAAWIAIFTGFAYFCTAIFGIYAALKRSRALMVVYLIIMFIIYLFECASCITAVTNRDYLIGNSNQVKHQMLKFYAQNSITGKEITKMWDKVMQEAQCCGTDGAADWMDFNSTFLVVYNKLYPWPLTCCKNNPGAGAANVTDCVLGVSTELFSQGCFSYIQSTINRYTWVISWYGFAIQILVFLLLVIAVAYTIVME
ncbi:Uroplakin-1a [Bagarius yarrelli]|uniref:Tetraspanin n=1 Tax=Bagarius yarrelli TaxID=175774 RepID=A0A556TM08_BAGYA|nr:Uroplakin-1a [Bagarius yarrelli]